MSDLMPDIPGWLIVVLVLSLLLLVISLVWVPIRVFGLL